MAKHVSKTVRLGTMLVATFIACGAQEIRTSSNPSPQNPALESGADFKVTSGLVVLDVSVRDSRGQNVAGLKREHFELYDNGKQRAIAQFGEDDEPVTIGFVIDTSQSMRGKHADLVAAVSDLIAGSNPEDQLFAVTFNDRVYIALPGGNAFTSDGSKLQSILSRAPLSGRTALFDGLISAMRVLARAKWEKRALVLVSDGGDNSSETTFSDVIRTIQRSRTLVYAIGIFASKDGDKNPKVLRSLADQSGAEVFFPRNAEQLNEACKKIAKDIRSRYTIAFKPEPDPSRSIHKIRVVTTPDAGRKLTVRTRLEYAPSPEDVPDRGKAPPNR